MINSRILLQFANRAYHETEQENIYNQIKNAKGFKKTSFDKIGSNDEVDDGGKFDCSISCIKKGCSGIFNISTNHNFNIEKQEAIYVQNVKVSLY